MGHPHTWTPHLPPACYTPDSHHRTQRGTATPPTHLPTSPGHTAHAHTATHFHLPLHDGPLHTWACSGRAHRRTTTPTTCRTAAQLPRTFRGRRISPHAADATRFTPRTLAHTPYYTTPPEHHARGADAPYSTLSEQFHLPTAHHTFAFSPRIHTRTAPHGVPACGRDEHLPEHGHACDCLYTLRCSCTQPRAPHLSLACTTPHPSPPLRQLGNLYATTSLVDHTTLLTYRNHHTPTTQEDVTPVRLRVRTIWRTLPARPHACHPPPHPPRTLPPYTGRLPFWYRRWRPGGGRRKDSRTDTTMPHAAPFTPAPSHLGWTWGY